MKKEIAQKILVETEKGYDLISGKFSQTRKHFWTDLEFIKNYIKDGDRVLDFGCGNGRLFDFLKNSAQMEYWGLDVSGELIDIANLKHSNENAHFSKTDPSQTSLAFSDNFFNTVYSVAVFHHIPSADIRTELVNELYRITKPGGYIIITVWNLWRKKYFSNIFKNWKNKILGKSELDWNDCYISFTDNQGKIFNRFHHAFTLRDLKKTFFQAGFKIEMCDIISGRNLVLIAKK
ncbi:MAG: hypothetical protein ACD_11C00091G0001 [uncultured bacterium]|nr:MAG: hypothetical protein ACD_11C00091G0001 [uncultured bacterium]HBR71733.1 hypothetical protein [Candidatus Moranbacteria bacterium]